MTQLLAEERGIFDLFEQNKAEQAGRRMATMDRKLAEVHSAILAAGADVRRIQAKAFGDQAAEADDLRRYELLVAMFVLLMVGAISIYGHKLSKAMKEADRTRAAQADALAEKAEALAKAKEAADARASRSRVSSPR